MYEILGLFSAFSVNVYGPIIRRRSVRIHDRQIPFSSQFRKLFSHDGCVTKGGGMVSLSQFAGGARLIALHQNVQPLEYLLESDECTIGRSPDCDIVVVRSTVSRLHARIERRGSHYVLHNLSRNQTFVNETPLNASHILRDRDAIGLALPEPLLFFQDNDPTAEPCRSRLQYDEKKMAFLLRDQWLRLAPLEFRLLWYLYQNLGRVCTYENCAQAAWGDDYTPDLLIDNLGKIVYRLRQELDKADPGCDLIETRRGLGYLLRD